MGARGGGGVERGEGERDPIQPELQWELQPTGRRTGAGTALRLL